MRIALALIFRVNIAPARRRPSCTNYSCDVHAVGRSDSVGTALVRAKALGLTIPLLATADEVIE
jgi:hypothetical protein